MWQCVKCREEVVDGFDVCWNCGTSKDGVEDPKFQKADDISPEAIASRGVQALDESARDPITCPRCRRKLDHVGTKAFHEGTRWGALGDLAELFVNKQRFDVYCCPRCGRVELFVDGIGEEFRSH
jgi:hypothetical protein